MKSKYIDSKTHKQAVRDETSLTKSADYFCILGTKSMGEVKTCETTVAIHTLKHHYAYKSSH